MKMFGFNYDQLESKDRSAIREHSAAIRDLLKRTTSNIIEVGHRLLQVRAKIGSYYFQRWLKAEFHWSIATASNYMRAADRFGCTVSLRETIWMCSGALGIARSWTGFLRA